MAFWCTIDLSIVGEIGLFFFFFYCYVRFAYSDFLQELLCDSGFEV